MAQRPIGLQPGFLGLVSQGWYLHFERVAKNQKKKNIVKITGKKKENYRKLKPQCL